MYIQIKFHLSSPLLCGCYHWGCLSHRQKGACARWQLVYQIYLPAIDTTVTGMGVTIRESLERRKSSSHRPANIGSGHNAQPGEEEPIFLWHRRQWRSYRKCCLVLGHGGGDLTCSWPWRWTNSATNRSHWAESSTSQPGTDEQNLVPNKRLLTIHPSQRKTLLFSNTPKNQITSNKKLWNRVRISCP